MTLGLRFVISFVLILASAWAGYLARTRAGLREELARPVMTVVAVFGYPLVALMAIWGTPLQWADAWLPVLGGLQATLMALIALRFGRKLFPDRAERGVVGLCCTIGNHGVTMAGFAVYLLFGREGLGINTVYALYTFFAIVLLSYTIAQRHSPDTARISTWRLMVGNLLHWRATGLYACVAAILLTVCGVPSPPQIGTWYLLDIVIYLLIAAAYFAIGLRLHLPHLVEMRKAVLYVLGIRHALGLLLGVALAGITYLTPWPLEGLSLKVLLVQSSVPVGIMCVAVANMFHIKPREAAAILVVGSVGYLVLGMPLLLWLFGA